MSSTIIAANRQLIFLFIFYSGCDILSSKSNAPCGGCPYGQLVHYFSLRDFLDFLFLISFSAVNIKMKISIKSFMIFSISSMASIPLLLSSALHLFLYLPSMILLYTIYGNLSTFILFTFAKNKRAETALFDSIKRLT